MDSIPEEIKVLLMLHSFWHSKYEHNISSDVSLR